MLHSYKREHPDAAKDMEVDEWYESENQRELRQIFSGQSQLFEQVRLLSQMLDEVVGRQERTLSLLSSIQNGNIVPAQVVQGQYPQVYILGLGVYTKFKYFLYLKV